MELKKSILLNQLKLLKNENKVVIHPNQEKIGANVVTAFIDRKIINVMVISKTQSGKTGSMCATIRRLLEDSTNLISTDNIFIITGLSSLEWKAQTRERMPESIQKRVYHRCELPHTFADEILNQKNILIIMDEIQIAAKKEQTIYKSFRNAGLLSKNKLYENDVKILEFTATPDGTIYDLMRWKDASTKILAEVGKGYVSSSDLLNQGRVKQFKELARGSTAVDNIREMKNDIDAFGDPHYHIIRTKKGGEQGTTMANFRMVFDTPDKYDFITYDGESCITDINSILSLPPAKHTFIFVKELLRCAKTLKKEYLGVLYERFCTTPDDTAVIQGLVGRDTGYDNNGRSICYTNIESIEKYEKLWESRFEDRSIQWNSKTTKFSNGELTGYDTFNDPNEYDGFSVSGDEENRVSQEQEPSVVRFNTQEEAKEFYQREFKEKRRVEKGRGPHKRTPNDHGFYEAIIRSKKRVYSTAEMSNERKYGLTKDTYRLFPCYRDVGDPSTLEWWFIYFAEDI